MSDESPPGREPSRQRLTALSRWENEGGSGPPRPTAVDDRPFNTSIPKRDMPGHDRASESQAQRYTPAVHRLSSSRTHLAQTPAKRSTMSGVPARSRTETRSSRNDTPLYPLRFEPLYQYRLWGGQRLNELLSAPLPAGEPVGEAWLLSDRDDQATLVADGPLKGQTIADVLKVSPKQLLGETWQDARFPLLLKFLDVRKSLSVQVHPSDAYQDLIPAGNTGKSEAWVILEAGPEARIYAGLRQGSTPDALRRAIAQGTLEQYLASFVPKSGDVVFIQAGIVHSLRDVVVFEVQQNSDVTFRLYDWGQVDPETHQPRPLQVNEAMECIDWGQGAIRPVAPLLQEANPVLRESLIRCEHFAMTRISGRVPFIVGAPGRSRVLVCLAGQGHLQYAGARYSFHKGDVLLLPAVVGARYCRPRGGVSLLELSLQHT
jgi:mannose-6-phosphate isomerase